MTKMKKIKLYLFFSTDFDSANIQENSNSTLTIGIWETKYKRQEKFSVNLGKVPQLALNIKKKN